MAFDSLLMVCAHCTVSTSRPTNAYVRHLPRHPAAHNEKACGRPSCNSVFHVARPASSSAQIESHKVLRLSVGSTPGKSGNRTSQVLELHMDDFGVYRDPRFRCGQSVRLTPLVVTSAEFGVDESIEDVLGTLGLGLGTSISVPA
jgi:hypothetical protein